MIIAPSRPSDSVPLDSVSLDTVPPDGEPPDGEPTDGEPPDGEPTDGEPPAGERASLDLQVLDCGRSCLVALSGELDLATSGLLQALLDDRLRARRLPRVVRLVLDLKDLTFVDAAGIAPVLHARAVLHKRGGTLELRRPSRPVLRLLDLLGLRDQLLATEPEVPEQAEPVGTETVVGEPVGG